jgi:hypothetical protein
MPANLCRNKLLCCICKDFQRVPCENRRQMFLAVKVFFLIIEKNKQLCLLHIVELHEEVFQFLMEKIKTMPSG